MKYTLCPIMGAYVGPLEITVGTAFPGTSESSIKFTSTTIGELEIAKQTRQSGHAFSYDVRCPVPGQLPDHKCYTAEPFSVTVVL